MPLCFIPTPLGNLDDITVRSLKKLESAQIVFCEDTRVAKKLLQLLSRRHNINCTAERFISMHSHNEAFKLETIDLDIFSKECVYISDAGMPCISDPGAKLVAFCLKNNISYEVLPGASAAITAFAACGFDATEFCFVGFLPHKQNAKTDRLKELLKKQECVVLYESPHRLLDTIKILCELEPTRDIFVIKEISKMYEKYFSGSAKEVCENLQSANTQGEWVVVINKNKNVSSIDSSIFYDNMDKKSLSKAIAKITGQDVKTIYGALTADLR